MLFDARTFLRLDAPQSLGTTASGGSFATATGDIVEVTCHGPGVFRLRAGPQSRPDYGLVVGRAKACTSTRRPTGAWSFASGDSALEISGGPLAFRLLHRGVPVLASSTDVERDGTARLPVLARLRQGGQWVASFALASGEPVYGLGGKFGPLDKRGQLAHSQVVDGHGTNSGASAINVPLSWGPGNGAGAWGLFANTPGMVSHGIGHPDWSHRSYVLLVEDEALDLFLFAADAPMGILDAWTQLCGRPGAVPDWSLGAWIGPSRFPTARDATAAAADLRARKIPFDVLVLDGPSAWSDETRFDFRWDPDRWPEPKAALAAIRADGTRVGVTESPYVSVNSPLFAELAAQGFLLTDGSGDPFVVHDGSDGARHPGEPEPQPSGIVDFTHPRAFDWWRDAHADLFADGIDLVRADGGTLVPEQAIASNGDRGTRLHNVYPLLYGRCVHDAIQLYQPAGDTPPLVLGRAGWAGSQRYPAPGCGDAQNDWEGLAAAIRGALSAGMSGMPFHALAVGGAYGTDAGPDELYVRWLQAAVFASQLCLAGVGDPEQDRFAPEVEPVLRKWLAFRYRLVPYLKGVVAEATRTGAPVMRAMALAFPTNPLLRGYETQFMCGDTLLVAPVLRADGAVEVALPPGGWYDLNSRQRVPGGRIIRYRASLDQFPVFGREGHALPLAPAVQHTGAIDAAQPLEQLWLFGKPAHPLAGFAQAWIVADAHGGFTVGADARLRVERFGDAEGIEIARRDARPK